MRKTIDNVRAARELLLENSFGVLSTISLDVPGYPFGSVDSKENGFSRSGSSVFISCSSSRRTIGRLSGLSVKDQIGFASPVNYGKQPFDYTLYSWVRTILSKSVPYGRRIVDEPVKCFLCLRPF
jgi:hypothetical protein